MRAAAAAAAQRPASGAAGEPLGGYRRGSAHRASHLHDFHEVDIQGRWAEPLPARWSYTPTLYTAPKPARPGRPSDEIDKPEVDPVCALVLSSFDEPHWNGRCRCTVDEQEAWFDMLDQDGSGNLDYSEVQQVMEASKKTFQRMLPGSVHGVLIESCVQDAFHSSFNEDHDQFLDLEEWNHFLDTLERRFLRYRKLLSFQSERAFYGRGWSKWLDQSNDNVAETPKGGGATPQGSEATSDDVDWAYFEGNAVQMIAAEYKGLPKYALQFGVDPDAKDGALLPVGWREDFWYYTCNYHPICGIFFCDPDHQLNWFERVQIELATIFSLFIAADFKDTLKKEEAASLERVDTQWVLFLKLFGDAAIWMVGVLGGMLVYYVFYLLFTCPQLGFVDESSASAQERFRAKVADRAGATIGYLLMLFLLVFVYYDWQVLERNWLLVLVGRSLAYLSYFFFFVAIPFNPVFAWGNCSCDGAVDTRRKFGVLGRAGDLVGIGQWRIQKQIFQAQCRKVVEEGLFPKLESSNKTTMKSLLRMSTDEWNAFRVRKIAAEFRRPLEARRGQPRGHLRRRQECAAARERPGGRGAGRAAAPALTLQLVGDVFSQADQAWRSWIGGKPWRELKE